MTETNKLSGNIFVTGGAGFLARAIYARAKRENWNATFTAFSRDENKHAALLRDFPHVRVIRGDVADHEIDRLAHAMAGHNIVIHAAASKHVDLSERAAWDTVRVNVGGSANVARAAVMARVEQVIGISTDKACDAINIYGMSKSTMERMFFESNTWQTSTRFYLTRYGNVLSSTGSVATLWRKQLAEHQPLTLTDSNMTRFWMTQDDAVNCILRALNTMSGNIVIPKLGALSMMEFAGIVAGTNMAQTKIIGRRPGEKMHESLISAYERQFADEYDDYFHMYPPFPENDRTARTLTAYTSEHAPRISAQDMALMLSAVEA